ncbi:hypothetical protein FACS189434_09210 [Bacteroidia bacterium]|nr:hypothetical protein FACS189434_09210 [Bacteroidia bacterium]
MSNLQLFNQTINNPKTQNYLQEILGERKGSFVNNITALVSSNATLQECEPLTTLYAAMKATALNLPLDPNLGFAYVLPYNDTKNNRKVSTFQLGYKGFIQLAMRSGQFRTINVTDIRDGEILKNDLLSGEIEMKMLPADRENAKIVGYAAYFKLTNGFEKTLYMCSEKLEAHGKKFSQTYKRGYGLWRDDFDSMARKTVLKLLLSKYAPLSVEMQSAITYDQAIVDKDKPIYIDNQENAITAEQSGKATDIIAKAFSEIKDAEVVNENHNELPSN